MGVTFKNGRFTVQRDRKRTPEPVQKSGAAIDVLAKLRAFLDTEEPELVYFLVNLWRNQGKAITYKELREAILAGTLDVKLLEEWQQDYARFVREYLKPAWIMAMDAATDELRLRYPDWYFDPMAEGVQDWAERRGAEFVTSVTQNQIEGLRAVVQRASVIQDINVDTLARAIRPMVGLYWQQSQANLKYFEKLIQSGVKEKRALDLAIRYGARQHRYRGYLIARTELAFAYNQGSYQGIKQAQEAGYMGEVVKIWSTADDERTCEICGALEGKQIALDEDFDFKTKLATPRNPTIRLVPPAHPSCRCSVLYEEVAPPKIYR